MEVQVVSPTREILINETQYRIPPTEIIVPRDQVVGLSSAHGENFKNAMTEILSIPLNFKYGELVRFRDSQGKLNLGLFVRSNGQFVSLYGHDGSMHYTSSQSVFKYAGGSPHTSVFDNLGFQVHPTKTSGLLQQFLDGAGKLTSLPDFIKLSDEQRILTLIRYLHANIKWINGAKRCEHAGFNQLELNLAMGAGVCRHLARLMGTLLGESGYSHRLTQYRNPTLEYGHAWVEAEVAIDSDRRVFKTLIVDPSAGYYVNSLGNVISIATQDQKSMEAEWYTRPEREYSIYDPTDLKPLILVIRD